MSGERAPVTACIVAMNEEDRLGDCLRSVDFADEVIVVDSHSTDRTRELAEEHGARVIERDWPGHIEQKNFALDQASNDWVFCIDADERVSPELRTSIVSALEAAGAGRGPDGYECARLTFYLGRWIRHGGWYPDRKLRLFRRSLARWGGKNPHDHVQFEGPTALLAGDLQHFSYRSLADHIAIVNSYTDIMARGKLERGERASLLDLALRPAWKFVRTYVFKLGMLDGAPGFAVAVTGAYYVFLKYAKLREMTARGEASPAAQSGDPRGGR